MPRRDSAADLLEAWGGEPPPSELKRFLALSERKRSTAVERVRTVSALVRCDRPVRTVQTAAAEKLGLSVKRLQALMRAWRVRPSLDAVFPMHRADTRRPRHGAGLVLARRLTAKAVAHDRWVAEPTVTRRVTRVLTRLGVRAPARMTIRRMLEQARANDPITLEDVLGQRPGENDVAGPAGPGSSLLLAEATFAATIRDDAGGRQAHALFVIDLATGFVMAHAPGRQLVDGGAAQRSSSTVELGSIGSWTAPKALHLALDLTTGESASIRQRAADRRIACETALRNRVRRYLNDVLSTPDTAMRIVAPTGRKTLPADWPMLSLDEFGMLLDDLVDHARVDAERRFEQRPYVAAEREVDMAEEIDGLLRGRTK